MTELFSSQNKALLRMYLGKLIKKKFNKTLENYQNLDSLLQNSIKQVNETIPDKSIVEINKEILKITFVKLREQENMEKLLSRNYEKTPEISNITQPNSLGEIPLQAPLQQPMEPLTITSDTLQNNGTILDYRNDLDSKPPGNVSFNDNSNENLPNANDVYDNILQQRKREDENIYSNQKKDSEEAMSWLSQKQSQNNESNNQTQGKHGQSNHSQKINEERFILLEQGNTINNRFSFVKTLGFIKSIKIENMILHEKIYKRDDIFGQQQTARLSDYPYIYVEVIINNVSMGKLPCFQTKQRNNKIFLSSCKRLNIDDLVTKIQFLFFNDVNEPLNIEYIVNVAQIHIGSTLTKTRKRLKQSPNEIKNDFLKMDYKYVVYQDDIIEHQDKVRINDDIFDLLGLITIKEDQENMNIILNGKSTGKNTIVLKNMNTINEETKMELITQSPKVYLSIF